MIKFKKWRNLTAKHPHNFDAYFIVKISSILRNIYIVSRDQEKIEFYVNNYID